MTQAVDATQSSTAHAKAQDRKPSAQAPSASFDGFLALAEHPAGGLGPGPETIGDQVRDENKNPGQVDLDDIAAEEMQSPTETPAHLKVKSGEKAPSPPATQGSRDPSPRAPSPATDQPAGAPDAKPTPTRRGPAREVPGSKPATGRGVGRSANPGAIATAAQAPAAASQVASNGGRAVSAPSAGGGVRSVGALSGGQASGKDLLAKLTDRQKPPILRASKEELPAQVSRALARVVSDGGGRITLRLNPQALGEVRVDVDMHRGVARATLHAQTDAARDLLHGELDTLRAALERRGVSVERLEVAGPTTDGSAHGSQTGASGGGDHSAATDGSGSHGRSAGRSGGSAETGSSDELGAEHGGDAMTGAPVRTDADGVVRVDAIA